MPSQSEIKVLETLTAALSCCEMVKLFHSESQHKVESAQKLLKDILSQYRYRLSVSEVKKVSEKIIYICDNVLFKNQSGYHASVINFALYLLEDRVCELSAKSKNKTRIQAFESAIKAIADIYSDVVPEDDPNLETTESIGKEAYEVWKYMGGMR